jgi:hypothetical protein
MKPHSIGRALGIGLRVAGRIAGQRIAASATAQPAAPTAAPSRAAQAAGQVARGVGGFLRPFRRVGGILWLEVMGAVFFTPVAVFAPTLWRARASYAHGPDHRTFLVTAGVVLVFLYLSLSSFWRARRR